MFINLGVTFSATKCVLRECHIWCSNERNDEDKDDKEHLIKKTDEK